MDGGVDGRLIPTLDRETGKLVGGHKLVSVYTSMLIQILLEYKTLPDPERLTMRKIRFYYNGLRSGLRRRGVEHAKLEAIRRK